MRKFLMPVFSISVFLLLLLSPVLYYSFDVHFYTQNAVQDDRVLTGQSMTYVQNIYSFIQWESQLDPIFTSAEKSHMQDVRQVYHILSIIEIVASILFVLTLMMFLLQKDFSRIVRWFFRGSLSALIFFLLMLLALRINFFAAFVAFHDIFFPQGNRLFDQSNVLITLFPLSFFEAIAVRIFRASAALSLVVIFLDFLERNYRRKKTLIK